MCLANLSAVSKPHPMEGAEIDCTRYTGCGNHRCYKACCAVCTPLHACRRARHLFVLLLLVVPFCCLDFFFPTARCFWRCKHNPYEHILQTKLCTAYDTCVARREKKRGRERFAVLCRVAELVAFGCRCLCKARCNGRSFASFGC